MLEGEENEAMGFTDGIGTAVVFEVLVVCCFFERFVCVEGALVFGVEVLKVKVHVVCDVILEVGTHGVEFLFLFMISTVNLF